MCRERSRKRLGAAWCCVHPSPVMGRLCGARTCVGVTMMSTGTSQGSIFCGSMVLASGSTCARHSNRAGSHAEPCHVYTRLSGCGEPAHTSSRLSTGEDASLHVRSRRRSVTSAALRGACRLLALVLPGLGRLARPPRLRWWCAMVAEGTSAQRTWQSCTVVTTGVASSMAPIHLSTPYSSSANPSPLPSLRGHEPQGATRHGAVPPAETVASCTRRWPVPQAQQEQEQAGPAALLLLVCSRLWAPPCCVVSECRVVSQRR